MSHSKALRHEFVELMPNELKNGVLYVSVTFATAVHLCCCGCGGKVITPLSPRDWKLIFDGETISLRPSIGNWSFECRSHYWITRNEIEWSSQSPQQEIEARRMEEARAKERYYDSIRQPLWEVVKPPDIEQTDAKLHVITGNQLSEEPTIEVLAEGERSILQKLRQWILNWRP